MAALIQELWSTPATRAVLALFALSVALATYNLFAWSPRR